MPEPKNPKPRQPRRKTEDTEQTQEKMCHIHNELKHWHDKNVIRKNVCISPEETEKYELKEHLTEFEGNYYCLFHLPTKEKDVAKFEEIFQARLEKIDKQCAEIDVEFPNDEEKQGEAKRHRNIDYDFCYIWFPSDVRLSDRQFSEYTNFSSATFNANANFGSATFSAIANFNSTIFNAYADFGLATFNKEADFGLATFNRETNFGSTTFNEDANFNSAIFVAIVYFNSTTFNGIAYLDSATFSKYTIFISAIFNANASFGSAIFRESVNFNSATFNSMVSFESALFCENVVFNRVTFEERSHIKFWNTSFCSKVSFVAAEVSGYFEFEGDVFLSSEKVIVLREEKGISIDKEQEAILEFQDVRLKNPERLSFSSIKLRPNWFVNVLETRKIEFSDVEWLNSEIDIDRTGLDRELECLRKRNVSRAEKTLINACNQLADNAEANRRFEDAKTFRKQSIALQNYDCHVGDGIDEYGKEMIRANVCKGYTVVNEDGGNYFCLLHNPDPNKAKIFLDHYQTLRELGKTDFRGVVFPISLRFYGELPDKINFSYSVFQREIRFHEAKINRLDFYKARFEKNSEFIIEYSECKENIQLDKAVLDGKVFINGFLNHDFFEKPIRALSMTDVRIEKPQNINFKSIRLRPHYFVGVDASKFILHDCVWNETTIDEELKCCSHKDLAQTANQIAINYEENRHFEESSFFRSLAMETKRIEKKGLKRIFNLYSFYKLTSSYGENWRRAALFLFLVLFFFGFYYATPCAKFEYGEKPPKKVESFVQQVCNLATMKGNAGGLNGCDSAFYSLAVSALQKPEPKPADALTKFFVILQTIFAPLQAALLALAIRRKFMR
ncbi:MAG TPA: pentapeptide repeat-containing protein [Pyrinomonadaceae bacterium]|nr:pentapeptide repeat-containing protein [Pyrinomonadaceae bacterium]